MPGAGIVERLDAEGIAPRLIEGGKGEGISAPMVIYRCFLSQDPG
jgi:hypothetical protein